MRYNIKASLGVPFKILERGLYISGGLKMVDGAPLRFRQVSGFSDRKNDLVFCKCSDSAPKDVVVFFPGDVQDFVENMQSHRDNKNYVKWNLEDTALVLHRKFKNSEVVVVKPSQMEYKTFSIFQNFVPSNKCGVPEHIPSNDAIEHLQNLIKNLSEKVPNLDDLNVRLVGFSKGCVVLNQLLHEFHYCQEKTHRESHEFVTKITDMYWLDGGHNGGENTWITSKELLETVAELGIKVHIHVTPYQIKDERRPWIRKEEKQFYETLLQLGAAVDRTVHFGDSEPDLNVHFDVINSFSI